ncbi:MAG: segregation/condensation protein A, partial [Deltaproteobacteria bacterium]|nr:segregation/condensation protein A [Deltaproteobacteria bacterium]
MQEELYQVKLDNIFEGPMDLLVHLIKKHEVDIYDIPIAMITDQYLEYLKWMESMNIDVAGDFIVMAATLTQIKSKMLLPIHENENDQEDPRLEIARPLAEYLQMKS